MKSSLLSRQWLWVTALAAICAVMSLRLALDTSRADPRSNDINVGTVTLTCFDRDMRPHECVVASTTKVATK